MLSWYPVGEIFLQQIGLIGEPSKQLLTLTFVAVLPILVLLGKN